MEQRFVSISPWESLSSDSKIFVFNEFWTMGGKFTMFQVCVQHDQTDGWDSNEE